MTPVRAGRAGYRLREEKSPRRHRDHRGRNKPPLSSVFSVPLWLNLSEHRDDVVRVEGDGLAVDADLGDAEELDPWRIEQAPHLEHRGAPVHAQLLYGEDAETGAA